MRLDFINYILKNMRKFFLLIIFTQIFVCCGHKKNISIPENNTQIEFNNIAFDIKLFHGKWLTNSKYDITKFVVFQEDGYATYSDKKSVPYKLKNDSIFIFSKKKVFKGRLINLTKTEVDILWGIKEPKERIKYYRPDYLLLIK